MLFINRKYSLEFFENHPKRHHDYHLEEKELSNSINVKESKPIYITIIPSIVSRRANKYMAYTNRSVVLAIINSPNNETKLLLFQICLKINMMQLNHC
jgi:hypothetical protein